MQGRRVIAGTSLIEVMVAVALLAMVMLGVAGSQLAMMRAQRTAIWRERALWFADARVEGARVSPAADPGLAALVAAGLPGGTLAVDAAHAGSTVVIVGWRDRDAGARARCDGSVSFSLSADLATCVRMPFMEAHVDDR
ncbi:type IV pilus modification PilV family protein [Burkholderia guangdongensis]|uniref:type IV pilus modification PilV family protein n=1 Tax=Burkholderia guangdongensis TaxID=1792500 RepID=UPI001C53B846|nr:hypothetical protein [Burkholderia guangdongensis]